MIRYYGFTSLDAIDQITFKEYRLLMENLVFREVDEDYQISKQAFRNFAVQATKKVGKNKEKPVYKTFKSFFDYTAENKKAKEAIEKPKRESRFSGLSKFIKQKGGSDGK